MKRILKSSLIILVMGLDSVLIAILPQYLHKPLVEKNSRKVYVNTVTQDCNLHFDQFY